MPVHDKFAGRGLDKGTILIGGDEFAVVLENEDYQNRKELTELFDKKAEEIRASTENKWEQVSVALGMAEYDPQSDTSVDDVIHRADKTMYENKRTNKERKCNLEEII